jgi:hypothetical protein
MDKDTLVRNLAEEGYVPEVNDRLADFTKVFDDITERQSRVLDNLDPILKNVDETTPVADLRKSAEQVLRESPQIITTLNKSLGELDRFFASIETKFGKELTAEQVNAVRKEMNRVTRAFKDDLFKQDTADAIGDATRARLDDLVDNNLVRESNAEWARLQTIRNTAEIFHQQQIDVGFLGKALGSYAGTILASGAGLSVAGPGGLVVAGLAARYGGDALAQFLRNRRFDPKVREMIVQSIRQDDELVDRLIKEANRQNKEILEKTLRLPPPKQ